jgi:hypothetical protein
VVDDIEGDIAVGVFGHLFGFEAQWSKRAPGNKSGVDGLWTIVQIACNSK